ncbi:MULTISPECIES: nucleoside hydrolase [Rhizobium/Agrobacterium group]|uniref:Nucleoside hydrolase n=1 Tax=Neorhizobium petrolearium TaxID=515361 RepID=A0ABY8M7B1_9HYPH|nr:MULTISPECIES: nucleoside hydrolase [Rhizobium/Agrobacterium group]KGE00668.1 nucleoside hydrolase [Rhizobium sp. YS-1r]MCC2610268.1 nucleoside hydrolase [Neorhizobium petrolearium]WGI70425.1 nucleoside hydrolase [Neorhizobium petrolearium]
MHKVIFDTDPGVDDAMALLFLHRHPEIDLLGVTTVFGNVPLELTTRNAQFLHREWNISAPISIGAESTLDPSRRDDRAASVVHGADGLGNIGVPQTIDWPLDSRPAYQFIIETVRANPGEVTLVAVGRMTNLALALRADPGIAGLVKEVVVMGGAFDVIGNVTPAAEANIHGDPEAADVLFTAPWKVTIAGLDVTMKTIMTAEYLDVMVKSGDQSVQLLSDLSQYYIDFYKSRVGIAGMAVHDSTACVYLVRPDLFTLRSGAVRVVCGGIADGATIQSPDHGRKFTGSPWDGHPSQRVCTDVRSEEVLEVIRAALVEGRHSIAV